MERLTQWFGDKDCGGVAGIAAQLDGVYTPDELINVLLEALAKYEDTGLSPEVCANYKVFEDEAISKGVTFKRIVELMEAERAGRLVALPCKVGDTVYIPNITNCSRVAVAVRVQGISISVSGRTILRFGGYPFESAWGDGCGRDWFLTREEAEAALRKENKG